MPKIPTFSQIQSKVGDACKKFDRFGRRFDAAVYKVLPSREELRSLFKEVPEAIKWSGENLYEGLKDGIGNQKDRLIYALYLRSYKKIIMDIVLDEPWKAKVQEFSPRKLEYFRRFLRRQLAIAKSCNDEENLAKFLEADDFVSGFYRRQDAPTEEEMLERVDSGENFNFSEWHINKIDRTIDEGLLEPSALVEYKSFNLHMIRRVLAEHMLSETDLKKKELYAKVLDDINCELDRRFEKRIATKSF